MRALCHYIVVDGRRIRAPWIERFTMRSSWRQLTDTATLTIPRNLLDRTTSRRLADIFTPGTPINVFLGDQDGLDQRFQGIVNRRNVELPFTLFLDDLVWRLKGDRITLNFPGGSLAALLRQVVPASITTRITGNVFIGAVRTTTPKSPAEILQTIINQYRVAIFFREGTLYAGLPYDPALPRRRHRIHFALHVFNASLEYRLADDFPHYIRAHSFDDKGREITTVHGFKPGFQPIDVHYYNLDRNALTAAGVRAWHLARTDTLAGTITIYGKPLVQHGDVVELVDPFIPERNQNVLVQAVEVEFSREAGYVQRLELGPIADTFRAIQPQTTVQEVLP